MCCIFYIRKKVTVPNRSATLFLPLSFNKLIEGHIFIPPIFLDSRGRMMGWTFKKS